MFLRIISKCKLGEFFFGEACPTAGLLIVSILQTYQHIHIYTHTYKHTHMYTHTCIHLYIHKYTTYTHNAYMHISKISIYIHIYIQIQTYNICIYICTNTLPYLSTFSLFPMLQWSVQMKARLYFFLKHCSFILCVGTCLLISVLRKWMQEVCKFEAILGQRSLVSSLFFSCFCFCFGIQIPVIALA